MSSLTTNLVYRGPAQQVCYDLVEFGYSAVLVPEMVYELPAAFADQLQRSNAHFKAQPKSVFTFGKKSDGDSASSTSLEQENK